MDPDQTPPAGHGSASRAVRHHLVVVLVLLALGGFAGWAYAGTSSTTYTSSTRVLINPSVGNPFSPTPASVRQDQATSLETEGQVVRSAEVLDVVAAQIPTVRPAQLERGVRVSVPPNTQVLEISFTAADKLLAQQVANAVADAYLANRQDRFEEVNGARVDSVEKQTLRVVEDLRAATAAAQVGNAANRAFNNQLSDALRNELVSLRAQRTALENSESPAGAVISPASAGAGGGAMTGIALPIGGAIAGLALGCLIAVLLERLKGRVRAADDVETAGLPVLAAVRDQGMAGRLVHQVSGRFSGARSAVGDFDAMVRRLRAHVLEREPRPDIVAVAPASGGRSAALVSEALAESFAKAGHRVVLVRTNSQPRAGLTVEVDGLAEALVHERLSVLDLLQPSVEPLLSLLPAGRFDAQARELLAADTLRAVLEPLVDVGYVVVVESPALDNVEGEAVVGAADLGLVVVTLGRTRQRVLEPIAHRHWKRGTALVAVVLGRRKRSAPSTSGSRFRGRRPGGFDGLSVGDPVKEQSAGAVR